MIRVGVFGAGGRMGREVCRAVHAEPDLMLAAAVDPAAAGRTVSSVAGIPDTKVVIADDAEALLDAEIDVAVDFTVPSSVFENIRWCIRHAMHIVVGTTGLSAEDEGEISTLLEQEGNESNVFVAPNFAIGAVLMMRFAELAAPYFDSAEVIELHHDQKIDAPSGTALATARRMAEASQEWGPDPTRREVLSGARGGLGPADIRVHSVRLRGLVAHQEVLLGTTGQSLTIRHDSYDRTSFMPGVILAVKSIAERPGVTVGLDQLLGL
jgi:4-hydroxy-tetrahydrodipicolinate reductase